jgi:hypothetical protein
MQGDLAIIPCDKSGYWRKDCTEKLEDNKISALLETSSHLIEQAFKVNIGGIVISQTIIVLYM